MKKEKTTRFWKTLEEIIFEQKIKKLQRMGLWDFKNFKIEVPLPTSSICEITIKKPK